MAQATEASTLVRTVNEALGIAPADITLGVAGVGPLLAAAKTELASHYGTLLDADAHFPEQPELAAQGWRRSNLAHLLIPFS